jgi:ATP-binding cassette subfamily F protein 3
MLHINDLTYRLGDRLLIDRATVAIPTGGRVGLVGRNGAGKSTLFRIIRGELSAETGTVKMARNARVGSVEQEAPGGAQTLISFVLDADVERSALLAEAETAHEPGRIAEIQTRLADIEAHAAPARAARILAGLGFDEAAQGRALSEFSGGWRMRVALAAVLFSAPDLLLLDEPTNYLDLEGAMWLVDYLKTYPATIVVISHDRDILDEVAEHILHLDRGKLTLWTGGYSSFERQRAEAATLLAKAAKKQDERRQHLQSFVDRFRASATKARQAQSRIKMLARLAPVAVALDDDVQPFAWPPVVKKLASPLVALQGAAVGYDGRAVLSRLSLSLQNDDRIGLIGANGNGKSTFAKLMGGRMAPLSGQMVRAAKMETGFFAQHQVDDLESGGTPYTHVAARMRGEPESKIRGRVARIGFSSGRADTPVSLLSGGEKARLLMGLATFEGPQLLILDEPTNHLDIDSRDELMKSINDYEGACILISHDRRLLEACAERLWLVADGQVNDFDGDLDDYAARVLGRKDETKPSPRASKGAAASSAKPDGPSIQRQIVAIEQKMQKFQDLLARVDEALANAAGPGAASGQALDLAAKRRELERALVTAEETWLNLSEQAELSK